jgi:hypothetical protein
MSGPDSYSFGSAAGMVADVQSWLANPSSNFGWIVIADDPFVTGSAKRVASRTNANLAARPTLRVTYSVCGDVDFNNDDVFPDDGDIIDYFNVLAGGVCATCDSVDFNGNTVFPEDQDIIDFFNVLAGGSCPS